jgi:hypothetical protein
MTKINNVIAPKKHLQNTTPPGWSSTFNIFMNRKEVPQINDNNNKDKYDRFIFFLP